MWQSIKFRWGLTWTRRSIIESILVFIAIVFFLSAFGWTYYFYSDYSNVVNEKRWYQNLAESRERNLVAWLNGHPVYEKVREDKVTKDVYFLDVTSLPFAVKQYGH